MDKLFLIGFVFTFHFCTRAPTNQDSLASMMEAIYVKGSQRDTTAVKYLLSLAYNPRVSHASKFYGMSVHQGCMVALSKISGKLPPHKISYRVDTVNIQFYKKYYSVD
jgi:hypothetical protein